MAQEAETMAPVPFGRAMRDEHFLFAPNYTPLNHGSYGSHPKSVQKRLHEVQALFSARPDTFVRYETPRLLDQSRAAIAQFLDVSVDEIVLVPNATTGANVVLRGMKFEEGDVIVHFSTVYGAVEKTLEYLKETTPLGTVAIEIEYPISDDELLKAFQDGVKSAKAAGKRVRLAVIDTISSLPGVVQPWEKLVGICRGENVLSLIDGAHSVGQISVNLSAAQPDFFVSNLHKWLFVPRACAVFYVPRRNQHLIRSSLPTSHGFVPVPREDGKAIFNPLPMGRKSAFVLLFQFVATLDFSPFFCVEEALRFRREVCGGEEKITQHCREISDEGGKRAAKILETEIMDNEEGSLNRCAFSNVRLPLNIGTGREEVPEKDAMKVVNWMAQQLVEENDSYTALFFHSKSFWTRFSGQIYLEMEDFDRVTHALKVLCERVKRGEYRGDDGT